jgi:drug/metabolite transporter (DMT)-like permease
LADGKCEERGFTPIFTILLAWLLWGESLRASELVGVLIVLLGVIMVGIQAARGETLRAE